MKRILIYLLILMIVAPIAGCKTDKNEAAQPGSIKTYRDISGITEEEIAAIERLKTARGNIRYGAL